MRVLVAGDDGNTGCVGAQARRSSNLGHHRSCHCWSHSALSAHRLSVEGRSVSLPRTSVHFHAPLRLLFVHVVGVARWNSGYDVGLTIKRS